MIAPRLKENRFVYKMYSILLGLKSRKRISDEEYFSPKI
jgi:hypothetical protein